MDWQPTTKEWIELATVTLRMRNEGKRIDQQMVLWIATVDEYGFEQACARLPMIAGKYTDSMVTDAIQNIASNDSRWPDRSDKVDMIAQVISGRVSKADIRAIALGR